MIIYRSTADEVILEIWGMSSSHVLGTSTSALPGFFVASFPALFSSLKEKYTCLEDLVPSDW